MQKYAHTASGIISKMAAVGFCIQVSFALSRPQGVRKKSSVGSTIVPNSTSTMYRQ